MPHQRNAAQEVSTVVVFTCPFCGGKCAAGRNPQEPTMTHVWPACRQFMENDPLPPAFAFAAARARRLN